MVEAPCVYDDEPRDDCVVIDTLADNQSVYTSPVSSSVEPIFSAIFDARQDALVPLSHFPDI